MEVKYTDLSDEQLDKLRSLEVELGCSLLAVEPNQNEEAAQ